MASKRKYTEADLIKFGNYILSPERKSRYTEINAAESVEERLSRVNVGDVAEFVKTLPNQK